MSTQLHILCYSNNRCVNSTIYALSNAFELLTYTLYRVGIFFSSTHYIERCKVVNLKTFDIVQFM